CGSAADISQAFRPVQPGITPLSPPHDPGTGFYSPTRLGGRSMSRLDDYANKYQCVRFERRDGILQMILHTAGNSLRWGFGPHAELPEAFHDVGADRDNRVVILTGTGAEFSGPRATPGTSSFPTRPPAERIDRIHWEGRHLLMRLLEIEVPVISAINGPAWRHSEIPLLADIVLAADTAQFQDSAHFPS